MKNRNVSFIEDTFSHQRDAFQTMERFFEKKEAEANYKDKILVIYGLKRTGKTTLLEQAISKLKNTEKCAYYIMDSSDTMESLEDMLEYEQKKGTKYIFIDEIICASGFVEDSSSLANVYSKEGMVIVLSGTDSLGFYLATNDSLLGKSVRIGTTHIPFAEYCRVLNINDMDEYIKFGGLMPDGEDRHFVESYEDACSYLRTVAITISHSLRKAPTSSVLEKPSEEELAVMIRKVVDKFSGVFDEKILKDKLAKASVTFVNAKLSDWKKDLDSKLSFTETEDHF